MKRLLAGVSAALATYAVVFAAGDLDDNRGRLAAVVLPAWALALAATWWATRGSAGTRRPVLTVVLLAAAVQLPGLCLPPSTSSDAYRYVWDGRVQLSGASPYRYAPLDDRLSTLRDPILFPGLTQDQRSGFATGPLPADRDALIALSRGDPRTVINRPRVPTIYPPVAQAWFTAVAAVTPWAWGTWGLQLASALLAVGIAALLARCLSRRRRDPRGALWFAWSPVAAIEAANGAHVDVLATILIVAAAVMATGAARRWALAVPGLLIGLAASVKLTPLAILPAFMPLRREGWRTALPAPVTAFATLAASYLPHLLVAGSLVVGYLPGYLREEGGRNRSAVLRLFLPEVAVTPAALAVMAAVALWALLRTGPGAVERTATLVFGALLLVTTPSYPWYAMPLVALAVLARRLEWLAVAVAGYVAYAGFRTPFVTALAYGAAGLVVAILTWRRRRHDTTRTA